MTKKELLILFIVTFVVIMIWIAADIYRSQSSVSISPKLKQALEPIDPKFDQETLERIRRLPNNE